jgi:hypothetical protein
MFNHLAEAIILEKIARIGFHAAIPLRVYC